MSGVAVGPGPSHVPSLAARAVARYAFPRSSSVRARDGAASASHSAVEVSNRKPGAIASSDISNGRRLERSSALSCASAHQPESIAMRAASSSIRPHTSRSWRIASSFPSSAASSMSSTISTGSSGANASARSRRSQLRSGALARVRNACRRINATSSRHRCDLAKRPLAALVRSVLQQLREDFERVVDILGRPVLFGEPQSRSRDPFGELGSGRSRGGVERTTCAVIVELGAVPSDLEPVDDLAIAVDPRRRSAPKRSSSAA